VDLSAEGTKMIEHYFLQTLNIHNPATFLHKFCKFTRYPKREDIKRKFRYE